MTERELKKSVIGFDLLSAHCSIIVRMIDESFSKGDKHKVNKFINQVSIIEQYRKNHSKAPEWDLYSEITNMINENYQNLVNIEHKENPYDPVEIPYRVFQFVSYGFLFYLEKRFDSKIRAKFIPAKKSIEDILKMYKLNNLNIEIVKGILKGLDELVDQLLEASDKQELEYNEKENNSSNSRSEQEVNGDVESSETNKE